MLSLDCAFVSYGNQVSNDSEAICIALYNAHIAIHTAIGTGGTVSKSRVLAVMRPKIKAGTSLADWEVFKSVFNLFKAATDVQPDKVVHQLLSCLDRDLLKLLYSENNELEGLTEKIYSS